MDGKTVGFKFINIQIKRERGLGFYMRDMMSHPPASFFFFFSSFVADKPSDYTAMKPSCPHDRQSKPGSGVEKDVSEQPRAQSRHRIDTPTAAIF
jgi:hypothetical protein